MDYVNCSEQSERENLSNKYVVSTYDLNSEEVAKNIGVIMLIIPLAASTTKIKLSKQIDLRPVLFQTKEFCTTFCFDFNLVF